MAAQPRVGGFVTPVTQGLAAGQVASTVQGYWDHWDGKDERANASEESRALRRSHYEEITNAYYNLATDFYEYGWGQSFHFAPMYRGDSLETAIARHEHALALALALKPGQRVADLGCGVGGPARELARLTGADILGVNNNAYQVKRAEVHTARAGLSHRCRFVKADFMRLPLADAGLDAVYAIEATCHAPDLEGLYAEIFRVLKPGAAFACYEWCLTGKYDPTNAEHLRVKRGIELGDGIADLRTSAEVDRCLAASGFVVEHARDLCHDGDVPWWQPMRPDWSITMFHRTRLGRQVTDKALLLMEAVGLAPRGSRQVSQTLITAADSLIDGAVLDIFTPMYFFVARKPATAT
jgi:sterol 24-C-methyltransferase